MDKKFIKVLVLFIFAMIVIMTHASVWNAVSKGCIEKFFVWPSLINFLIEGYGIYWIAKNKLD